MSEIIKYLLQDGRFFYVQNGMPAVSTQPSAQQYWMGADGKVVVGVAAVMPDPAKIPEMIAGGIESCLMLMAEKAWPKAGPDTPLVRGVIGDMDESPETLEEYLKRLHMMGFALQEA